MNIPPSKHIADSNAIDSQELLHVLKVGERLQLCTPYDDDEQRYPVTLIGWLAHQSIIVAPPHTANWPLLVKLDQEYTIRLFSGTSAFAFTTSVLSILDRPYEHLHLSYPAAVVAAPVRRVERVKVDIPAEVEAGVDEIANKAFIVDASVLGVRILATTDFGDIGDVIKVSFRLKTGGKEWPISLLSTIRNKQTTSDANPQSSLSYYGVEFQSVDDDQALIITSFLYEQKTSQK